MESVSSDQVDELIGLLVALAIEHVVRERLTHQEARLIRAALADSELDAQINTAKETVLAALLITVPDVFNAALGFD